MSSVTFHGFVVLKVIDQSSYAINIRFISNKFQIFPPMVKLMGLHGCLWFFSAVCFLGDIITIFYIPETKGKSLIVSTEESEMLHPESKKVQIVASKKPLIWKYLS